MAGVPPAIRQQVYEQAFNQMDQNDQNILLRLERKRNLNRLRARRFRDNNRDEINERQRARRRAEREQIDNILAEYNERLRAQEEENFNNLARTRLSQRRNVPLTNMNTNPNTRNERQILNPITQELPRGSNVVYEILPLPTYEENLRNEYVSSSNASYIPNLEYYERDRRLKLTLNTVLTIMDYYMRWRSLTTKRTYKQHMNTIFLNFCRNRNADLKNCIGNERFENLRNFLNGLNNPTQAKSILQVLKIFREIFEIEYDNDRIREWNNLFRSFEIPIAERREQRGQQEEVIHKNDLLRIIRGMQNNLFRLFADFYFNILPGRASEIDLYILSSDSFNNNRYQRKRNYIIVDNNNLPIDLYIGNSKVSRFDFIRERPFDENNKTRRIAVAVGEYINDLQLQEGDKLWKGILMRNSQKTSSIIKTILETLNIPFPPGGHVNYFRRVYDSSAPQNLTNEEREAYHAKARHLRTTARDWYIRRTIRRDDVNDFDDDESDDEE